MANGSNQMAVAQVELARVLPGAKPFSNLNVNDTWSGLIETADGTVVLAILKSVGAKELANELLAAAIGRTLGLPIPRPFLCFARENDLQAEASPGYIDPNLGPGKLVFGSELRDTPALYHLIRQGGAQAIQKFAQWSRVAETLHFDTWIANTDRHENNLLFDGKGDVWLIDHERCFTGPQWLPSDLVPDHPYDCRMADWLFQHLTPSQRASLTEGIDLLPVKLSAVSLAPLATECLADRLFEASDLHALLQFLAARCNHLPMLVSSAVGKPRLV